MTRPSAEADELMGLAARCEAATGADRELDALIAVAVRLDARGLMSDDHEYLIYPAKSENCGPGTYWFKCRSGMSLRTAPAYTASLDAAMTLVPERWGWLVSQPNAKAIASGLLKQRTPVMGEVEYGCDHSYRVAAATPALAICAAALRARAHQGGKL